VDRNLAHNIEITYKPLPLRNTQQKITKYFFYCDNCNLEYSVRNDYLNKKKRNICFKCENKSKQEVASKLGAEKCRKRPYERVYNRLVYAAKRRDIQIDLSYEDFLEYTRYEVCTYCNDHLIWEAYSANQKTYLDRKDNSLGYHKNNCTTCCWSCNEIKGDKFTYDEFMLLAPTLRKIRETRQSL
jgi:hypothetical protein